MLVFSVPCVAGFAIYRNLRRESKFVGLIGLMFFTLSMSGGYYVPRSQMAQFPWMLLVFAFFAVVITWLVSSILVPVPAGMHVWWC